MSTRTLERVSSGAVDSASIVPLRIAEDQSSTTVALVEVQPLLADSIKYTLERDGHRVVMHSTRGAALTAMKLDGPGLVLLELAEPSPEALDFCRNLRASCAASIIMITPSISDADRVDALQAGANDLLIKPFSVRELAHRVSDQLRRARSTVASRDSDDEILHGGPVEMDVANHEVRVRGKLVLFPPKEFALLETLLRSRGRLQTRDRLMGAVWGPAYYGDGKTLDTHVKRLREKIEVEPRRPIHLIVVRGLGYRFLDRQHAD
jgi:two-component system response regulator RegX3